MKTGYCFLRRAVTRISASSCFETAATCTRKLPLGLDLMSPGAAEEEGEVPEASVVLAGLKPCCAASGEGAGTGVSGSLFTAEGFPAALEGVRVVPTI